MIMTQMISHHQTQRPYFLLIMPMLDRREYPSHDRLEDELEVILNRSLNLHRPQPLAANCHDLSVNISHDLVADLSAMCRHTLEDLVIF